MREIKYRAWEKHLKEIIPVHDIDFQKKMINSESAWRFIDEVELMQYTGLKDENGMEIYEHDIVDWNDIHYKICIGEFGLRDLETESVVDMVYGVYGDPINESVAPFCYQMPINNTWIQNHRIHVIGNIYENSELLEK